MSGRSGRARPAVEQLGAVVERLSALLGAGLSPAAAWQYVAVSLAGPGEQAGRPAGRRQGGAGRRLGGRWTVRDVVLEIAAQVEDSVTPGDAIHGVLRRAGEHGGTGATGKRAQPTRQRPTTVEGAPAWRLLGASWVVATAVGAPLARSLGELADALRELGRVDREVSAALAGPAASTALVTALPLVSLVLGSLLGLDSFRVLVATPAGVACLVVGVGLLLAGRAWSGALVRGARRRSPSPGVRLDLLALAMGGGSALVDAERLVRDAAARFDLDLSDDSAAEAEILALASGAGARPADLLRQEAARIRRDDVTRATERATALGVWLMAPLGLCVLPSFVLLSVAPIVIGVLAQTGLVT